MLSVLLVRILLACSVAFGSGCEGGEAVPGKKEIAITFDDAPVMRFYSHPSPWHRQQVVDSLAQVLGRYQVPATVFAVGNQVEHEEGAALMRYWMEQGVRLANHTMSHRSFNELGYEEGLAEINQATAVLTPFAAEYGQQIRYFRFPFLEEGATPEQKAQWQRAYQEAGLRNARVTINTDDWKFDEKYTALELEEDWAARYEVGQAYLQHVQEAISFWDSLAVDLYGRNVKHVLMLHANRVNRDYLGAILAHLKEQGFTFISLDEAYQDPLYQEADQWVSEEGTSFLENIKQTRLLAAETTDR